MVVALTAGANAASQMRACDAGRLWVISLGPHVRFRRVQTLVREGSPLVKLRNSACRGYALGR